MNNIEEELLKAISRQVTDNVPKLYIQDVVSGRVFEYGGNCHDRLLISEDGRSLTYYNLQNGDGSCVGDYRFFYEKPQDETDFDADEWARMVKHQSITELLAEERKRVVQEIRDKIKQTYPTCYVSLGEKMFNSQLLTIEMKSLTKILDQIERSE